MWSYITSFYDNTLENILSDFYVIINKLEKLEERLLGKVHQTEYLIIGLRDDVYQKTADAKKAREVAEKLRKLVG